VLSLSLKRPNSCPDLRTMAANDVQPGSTASKMTNMVNPSCPDFSQLNKPFLADAGTPQTKSRVALIPRLISMISSCPDRLRSFAKHPRGVLLLGVSLVVLAGFLNTLSALPFNWWKARNPGLDVRVRLRVLRVIVLSKEHVAHRFRVVRSGFHLYRLVSFTQMLCSLRFCVCRVWCRPFGLYTFGARFLSSGLVPVSA